MELYKKYRPEELSDLYGQSKVVKQIAHFVANKNLPHALLFTGTSGVGKTTMARILKEELGCFDQNYKEINASDVRGIDMVREIIEESVFPPMTSGAKIYVIDECHKLTTDAQNAFLKVLEDAPDHAYYFFCTSDPTKLIKAIHTRMTLFHFAPLDERDIVKLITSVVEAEGAELDEEDTLLLAKYADGSARKALVALESVLAGGDIGKVVRDATVNLPKALLDGTGWSECCDYLKQVESDSCESVRMQICGYMSAVILNRKKKDNVAEKAYKILAIFDSPCYNKSSLIKGCFEAMYYE